MMMKNKILLNWSMFIFAIIYCLLSPITSIAEENKDRWEYIATSKTGSEYFVDTKTIQYAYKGNKNYIDYWEMKIFSQESKNEIINIKKEFDLYNENWDKLKYIITKMRTNLTNKESTFVYVCYYTDNGEVLETMSTPEEFLPVVPDSVDEAIFNFVKNQVDIGNVK